MDIDIDMQRAIRCKKRKLGNGDKICYGPILVSDKAFRQAVQSGKQTLTCSKCDRDSRFNRQKLMRDAIRHAEIQITLTGEAYDGD